MKKIFLILAVLISLNAWTQYGYTSIADTQIGETDKKLIACSNQNIKKLVICANTLIYKHSYRIHTIDGNTVWLFKN